MEYLQENFYKKSNKELTKILDKTTSAIETKAYKMGLIISNKWTDEELKYLVANYSSVDNKDIIKFIDRNIDCIIMKAMELGLKKEVFNKKYNPDEFLNNLSNYAKKLGRTPLVTEDFEQEWALPNASLNRYFGGYRKVCQMLDLDINANIFGSKFPIYKSNNGDLCWSKAELYITNFFIDNSIEYKREVYYRDYAEDGRFNNKTSDWIINNNTFVEYFGMMDKDYYYKKAINKMDLCSENDLKLISLTQKHLTKLNKIFEGFIS